MILNIAISSGSLLNIVNFKNIVNIYNLNISTMTGIFQKIWRQATYLIKTLFDAENFRSTKKIYEKVSIILCREDKNYLNNIYDCSGNSKYLLKIFSDLTGTDKLCQKISKENFFVGIRLHLSEPRFSDWNPKVTKTAFTQLQQPKDMLQQLSTATLKHYGYNQPLESKIFRNNFLIPSFDGSADFTSSDSEPDTNTSECVVQTKEKRVCAYISKNNQIKHKEIDNKADRCILINQTALFSTSLQQLPKNYSSLEIFLEPQEASTDKGLAPQNKRQQILTLSTQNEGNSKKS